ncbi:hypothetical protein [Megalodesulfovibrio gigas]|nr:hypothetical protein [Megalodesulfovibrio gigas]
MSASFPPLFLSLSMRRVCRLLLAAWCVLCCTATAAQAQPQRIPVPPVDQSADDASFQAFKAQLGPAMQGRDPQFLARLVVDNRPTGFGLTPILEFFTADPCGLGIWDELARAVALGCVAEDQPPADEFDGPRPEKQYLCPYLIASEYPESLDLFETVVAVDANVPVHAEPSAQAAVVGTLSHEAVAVTNTIFGEAPNATADGCAPMLWHEVDVAGVHGFVNATRTLSPVDCRFVLSRLPDLKEGEGVEGWVLQDIYCGD